jgi:ribosomal protein S18 acetylase RimI-like enzyme
VELNEVGWWAEWGSVRWLDPESYLLTSRDLDEPFFNRGGLLSCGAPAESIARIEKVFRDSGREPVVSVFDSCRKLSTSLRKMGYTHLDKMTVMRLSRPNIRPNRAVSIRRTTDVGSWCDAYLLSFYGDLSLKPRVLPILSRLARSRRVTMLEANFRGRLAGVTALYRTPDLLGLYCLGTVPECRRMGVAHSLLDEARRVAKSEGRTLVLQSLVSEGAVSFYYKSGFKKLYIKNMLRGRAYPQAPPRSDTRTSIKRDPGVGPHLFTGVFEGFDGIGAVRRIFGEKTREVLSELQVEVVDERGYMHINAAKGSVVVSAGYLKDGDGNYLYLDIIHELVHIRQHMEGKELWDRRYKYVDRPTELEAYEVAVAEARNLGFDDNRIADYLKVEWVSPEDFIRFLENLGVKPSEGGGN